MTLVNSFKLPYNIDMRLHHTFLFFLSGILSGIILLITVWFAIPKIINETPVTETATLEPSIVERAVLQNVNPENGLFRLTMSEITDVEGSLLGDYLATSPDGKHVMFSVEVPTDTSNITAGNTNTRFYLANLQTGTRKEIIGTPLHFGWQKENVLLTSDTNRLMLFDTVSNDSPLEEYRLNSPITSAFGNEEETLLIINTNQGIALADRSNGAIKYLPGSNNGKALLWASDNKHIFGFHKKVKSRPQDEDRYELVKWSLDNLDYDPLPNGDFFYGEVIQMQWLKKNESILLATGIDDGFYIYIYNIVNNTSTFIGESPNMEMDVTSEGEIAFKKLWQPNSLKPDFSQALFWVENGGNLQTSYIFNDILNRYNVRWASQESFIYLRQDPVASTAQTEVVLFNISTNQETVLRTLPIIDTKLTVIRDGQTTYWLATNQDRLMLRSLDSE